MTEYEKLMEILEDVYWRLKDLPTEDLDPKDSERVDDLITSLNSQFS